MSDTRAISIEVNQSWQSAMNIYCDSHQMSNDKFMRLAIEEYLANHEPVVSEFARGYQQMGEINREICHEFDACEQELDAEL